jgi:eukaryotic-like serine/threonine-protein kinase
MTQAPQGRARLGPYELDTRAGELRCNGDRTVLPEQQFKVLMVLIERHGDIATREEIRKKLWPNDTIVEFEFGINNTIKNLRRALCDSADEPKYIETIKGRGYRLIAPVEWVGVAESAEQSSAESSLADSGSCTNSDTQNFPKTTLKVGRLTGKVVSHYRVLEVIGGGGMGLVYRAEDLKLGRAVALKFLPEEVGDDPKARERFELEAKAVSALSHINICPIYEFDDHEGLPFLAMERLQGKTLRDHLAAGRFRLTQREGLEIAIQIASGLEAAHEKGIIHRDIKPANIFITEKNVAKILDFGVAKVVALSEPSDGVILSDDRREESKDPCAGKGVGIEALRLRSSVGDGLTPLRMTTRKSGGDSLGTTNEGAAAATPAKETTLTRTGMKPGTAGYMSPEQVRGEPLDARTDIFSFGLVLYEMATGERAFTGETEAIVHDAIQYRDPKPVREMNPELAPKLDAIINKALEKAREQRYQNAAEVRTELEQVNASAPLSASPTAEQRRPRWKWYAVPAILTLVVTVGALYWRSRTHIKLTDKDTIVLADFQNLTGDKVMDDALDWPLYEEFAQSPYFNMLYPSKVRDILREMKADEAASNYGSLYEWQRSGFTPELARQVCVRSSSRTAITASVTNAGNYYRVVMNAQDCYSRRTLAKVQSETNDRNQIVHTIGTAGYQLRRELGEPEASLKAFNTPVENDTSPSLEAVQAFNNGLTLAYKGKYGGEATAEFKRTIQLDPNVAIDYVALAVTAIGDQVPSWSEFQAYMAKAFELRGRVSLHQRWFIETIYYALATGEVEKANSLFEQWIQTYPTDIEPHYSFSDSLGLLGQYEKALAEARVRLRLMPVSASFVSFATYLMALNRLVEARTVLEEAQKQGFDNWGVRSSLYALALVQHDKAAMQEHLATGMNKPGGKSWAMLQPADLATYSGRLREASKLYSAAQKELQWSPENTPDEVVSHLAIAYAETGIPAHAKRYVENILSPALHDDWSKATLSLVLARTGAVDKAESIAKSLDQKFPAGTLVQNFQLPAIRAAIALERKQPAQAVEELKPALQYDLAWGMSQCQRLYPAYLRGIAYLQMGKGREASNEFQKIIDHPGIVGDCPTGPLSYLQLARAEVMTGDAEAARKSYQEFLTLWKDADPDIPIYRQAKTEYTRLQKTSI